jgi:plastocyanin
VSRRAVGFLLVAAAFAVPGFACAGTAVTPAPKPPVKVTVLEFEYGYKLSRRTVPPGRVTFLMGNSGAINHNFVILGVKAGAFLVPGQRATMTVNLKKGKYTYVCTVKYHAAQGMQGTLYVK